MADFNVAFSLKIYLVFFLALGLGGLSLLLGFHEILLYILA